ncbi:unnamed protein product [Ostreobium quekettii]|uniref:SET domain-containing protein n=1 Tax=Ostreobium quekettii TaxID=121088 RepID=A0A8S1JGC9_9CHLO|nr:unnamed protein product [Ostreobium quekettii]|eukprot:evm.model.scf_847EXC.8 EVM.evm.TU.scf_847EXC.8   scf_847EXC:45677-49223(+)
MGEDLGPVRLRESQQKGRHLVAGPAFLPGAVVLSRAPYQAVLYDDQVPRRCGFCFRAGAGLRRCGRSKFARYDSLDHQRRDWEDGYREECAALRRVAPRVPPATVRLAARVFWKRMRQAREGEVEDKWDASEAIDGLTSHWEKIDNKRKVMYAQMAVTTREFMRAAMQGTDESALPEVKEIALMLARFACNNHTICDDEQSPVGVGIYPLMALVNHSNTPNCVQAYKGKQLEFRAVRRIEPGEEVTISYIDLLSTHQERREALMHNYFFDIDEVQRPVSASPEVGKNSLEKTWLLDGRRVALTVHGRNDGYWKNADTTDRALTEILFDNGKERVQLGGLMALMKTNDDDSYGHDEPDNGASRGDSLEHGDEDDDYVAVDMWGPRLHDIDASHLESIACQAASLVIMLRRGDALTKRQDFRAAMRALSTVRDLASGPLFPSYFLGPCHILQVEAAKKFLRAAMDEGSSWEAALQSARFLKAPYSKVYPSVWPNMGLHWAIMAKLELFCGDPAVAARIADKGARVLQITHGDSSVLEDALRLRYDAERCLAEAKRSEDDEVDC